MYVTDKLVRPLTEAKYLNADNVDRYRSIMRIFYENYEKLKYWMYQEEVYSAMIQDPYFSDYRLEQCQQDLNALTEWRNLVTIHYGGLFRCFLRMLCQIYKDIKVLIVDSVITF